MATQPSQVASEMNGLLGPILVMPAEERNTSMGRSVGEGFVLPGADTLRRESLPREEVGSLLADSVGWICAVVRSDWLPEDLGERLFAMRRAVNDEDAFVGAWRRGDRMFQVVVMQDRLVLLTRVPAETKGSSPAESALALAYELLRLPDRPNPGQWVVRPFGGLVLGYRDLPFKGNWDETLFFVTDGAGVKYSLLTYENRTGPMQRESGMHVPVPWFPREETEGGDQPEEEYSEEENEVESAE